MFSIRDRADRSWPSGGSRVPAVAGPGFSDESSGDDDRGGEGDVCVDHLGSDFGADLEFPEPSGVPGVGAFHDPSGAGLQGRALLSLNTVQLRGWAVLLGYASFWVEEAGL
jgi:hypothetical protein